MSNRREVKLLIFLVFMVIGFGGYPNLLGNGTSSIEPQSLQSGSLNGIDYTWGANNFYASGNFSQTANASITETSNVTSTVEVPLELLTGYDPYEILYRLEFVEYDPTDDETLVYTEYKYNASFWDLHDFLSNTSRSDGMPARFNSSDYGNGIAQMGIVWEENVRSENVIIVDQNDNFLGQFPSGVVNFEYNYKYTNGTVTRKSMHIITHAIWVDVSYTSFDVIMTTTSFSAAYMSYQAEFANSYDVSATMYQVNITDGKNLGIGVGMFDNITAVYTEYIASWFGYYYLAFEVTQLQFKNPAQNPLDPGNATVEWEMYPKHLLPKSYQADGSHVEIGYREVTSTLLSTFQGITAAFASINADVSENQAQIEGNLAVWGLQSVPTLAAYRDVNDNNKFDLEVDNDGLKVSSSDRLEYLGVAEAYESTVVNAYYDSHVYNESVQLHGLGVNITNSNVNETETDISTDHHYFGNPNADVNSTFFFEDPTTDSTGNVVFDFGIDYQNFPVTWINMTNPADSFIENQDIGYHYIVKVNPETGKAKISPTWIYGGMEDQAFKDAMSDLSLAWIVKSEFFAVQAVYTATLSDEPVNSTSTKAFGTLRFKFGSGEATEIDVSSPKDTYYLNGETIGHTASFEAIKIVEASGSFSAEKVSPFKSESTTTAGTATVGSLVETLNVNFYYTAALIIISYPEWDGQSLVHDPDYNVNYAPSPDEETTTSTSDTSDTSDSSETPTTTSPTQQQTSSKEDEGDVEAGFIPGFGLLITFVTFAVILRSRKK